MDAVRFVILFGHAFGLSSAVLKYNRQPELLVAAMRCLFWATCTHFYDDHLSLEPSTAEQSARRTYVDLCKMCNVHLDTDKHENMCADFTFVGCSLLLRSLFTLGEFTLAPKPGRCEKVASLLRDVLDKGECSPALASTIRGKLGFVSSTL